MRTSTPLVAALAVAGLAGWLTGCSIQPLDNLAAAGAPDTDRDLFADLCGGALCLWSGFEGALLFVRDRARSVTGEVFLEQHLGAATAMQAEAASLLAEVRRAAGSVAS